MSSEIISRVWQELRAKGPLLLLIALLLLAALPILSYPMGRDQGMYANIGRSILQGGRPFIDMWDIKPPPIYYLYAMSIALFGPTTSAIRSLDFLLLPIGMLGLAYLGQRLRSKRSGLLAAMLYAVFYFTETFASLSQNDSLVTVPMILAVVAATISLDAAPQQRRALAGAFISGALCGLILWFKHYNIFFVLALAGSQILIRRRDGYHGFPLRDAVAFCAGGLLTGGSLLAFFASQGSLQEMLIVAQGTAAYNAQGYDLAAFVDSMLHYLAFRWYHWGLLLLLAAAWLPLRLWRNHPVRWTAVMLWLLAGLCFALIQAKGFDTHWLPMLPPLALLGAASLDAIITRLGGSQTRLSQGLTLLSILVGLAIIANTTWRPALPYFLGQESQSDYYARFQANDLKPDESLAMVEYLRERVAPGDTLFVWGFRPEIAYMGQWRPATRFQAHFPLVAPWYPEEWKQENVDVLWAAMPPYALIMQADYMPWVTDRDEDSHELLVEYTELNNWLAANYERDGQIGNFLIWRRQQS